MSNIQLNSHLTQDELLTKIKQLEDKLFDSKLSNQKCESNLEQTKSLLYKSTDIANNNNIANVQLNRIYNPLIAPERSYSGGRFNIPAVDDYQQLGFVYNESERYPLFGRPKYPGRTDKYEYYIIDESRNRLKIPFKSSNDNEIYDEDSIKILNKQYKSKIYEYDNIRYNPNLI